MVRRITRDLHTHTLIESLDCDLYPKPTLHRRCLLGSGCNTPATRRIETCFMYRIHPLTVSHPQPPGSPAYHPFQNLGLLSRASWARRRFSPCRDLLKRNVRMTRPKGEGIIALRQLLQEFENHLKCDDDRMSMSSNGVDEHLPGKGFYSCDSSLSSEQFCR